MIHRRICVLSSLVQSFQTTRAINLILLTSTSFITFFTVLDGWAVDVFASITAGAREKEASHRLKNQSVASEDTPIYSFVKQTQPVQVITQH